MGDRHSEHFACPFDELYDTRRDAYETGKFLGASEAISWARSALAHLSVKYEPLDDPSKFHAVEECGAALKKIADQIAADRERAKAGGNQS